MKKRSKLLLGVLSFILLFATAVILVGASDGQKTMGAMANGKEYATFEEAFEAIVDEGGKITLLSNAYIDYEYRVSSSIEIDLAGYTINAENGGFVTERNTVLTITGEGSVYADSTFLKSTVPEKKSTEINVIGGKAPIYIYFNPSEGNNASLVDVYNADCNFENVEIRSSGVATGQSVFITADATAAQGTMTFKNVNIFGVNHLGQQSSVIKLRGSTLYKFYNTSIISNTAVFSVNTKTTKTIVEAEDSQFITKSTSYTDKADETGTIGVYGEYCGKMYFKNSLVEGGYRPILLKGNETSLIHFDEGSVLKYTAAKSSAYIRTCNLLFTGGSSMVSAVAMNSLSDTSGYVSMIDIEPGTRMSYYMYSAIIAKEHPELRVARNVDGTYVYERFNYGSESCNYDIIYDPVGNSDVPYVLVDKYEREANGAIKLDGEGNKVLNTYTNVDIGEIINYTTGVALPEGLIRANQSYHIVMGNNQEFPIKEYLTWNKATGSIYGYNYGGNGALRFEGGSTTSQNSVCLVNNSVKYNYAPVMIFEVDIATDSELGFSDGALNVNVRNASGGSGGSNGARIQIENGYAYPYGMTVPEGKEDVKYELDKDGWTRITMIFYTDTSITDNQLTASSGKAYYYINGELVGETVAYKKDAGTVYGIRFDSNAGTLEGSSILFDNVLTRAYDNYLTEGESLENTNPDAYLRNGGMPEDLPVGVMGTYLTAGKRYDKLDDALAAAKEFGSFITLMGDVKAPQKVTVPCVIYANGYKMNIADDSLGARVVINADGSNYSYTFSPLFNDLSAAYQWFIGDVNSTADLMNPDMYVTTTVALGEIPTYMGAPFVVDEKNYIGIDDIYDYAHIGWSSEIGASVPDELLPLSLSDAINHKEVPIKVFPVFGYEKRNSGYTWVITDENGNLAYDASGAIRAGKVSGTQYSSFWKNTVKLGTGETFNLFADLSIASGVSLATAADVSKPYGFNLNGHTLSIDAYMQNYGYGNRIEGVFGVSNNCTLNVYSAYSGAEITSLGYNKIGTTFSATPEADTVDHSKNDYSLTGGVIFRVNAENANLNVGSVNVGGVDYSGSNLSVKGDCLAWMVDGDNSNITIDGISYVRTTSKYNAVLLTRDTNGVITVKNSTMVLSAGGALLGNLAEGDGASAAIEVKDSVIVMAKNGANAVFRNKGLNSILIENCVTNAALNAGDNAVAGKGTVAYSSTFTAAAGAVNAKASIPMTLAGLTDESVFKTYAYNTSKTYGDFSTVEFTVLGQGAKGAASLKLPTLSVKVLGEEDAVKFTFMGLGENEAQVLYYNPGTPTDSAPAIESYKLNYVELVHSGKFNVQVPEIANESIVFVPSYTMKSILSGLKTSVTLYTDFVFNLYVPSEYMTAIGNILYGGKALEYADVEIDGASYIKISLPMLPKNAAEDIEFTLEITDSGYIGTTKVVTSVAEYAEEVMKDAEKYAEEEQKLAYAMLVYANEAAIYHKGAANEEFASLIEEYYYINDRSNTLPPSLDGAEYVDERTIAAADVDALGEVFLGVKVRLSSTPSYSFTLIRGFVGTVTVKYGSVTREFKIEGPADRTVILDGMNAADFAKTLYISVSGEMNGNAVEINGARYNLAAYLQYHENNVAEEGMSETEAQYNSAMAVPLIKALLNYVIAADDYSETLLGLPDESVDSSDEYVPEGDTPLTDVEIGLN